MSLFSRLADSAEALASASNSGSPRERAALAYESLAGVSNLSKGLDERIALATEQLATDAGETPATENQSFYQRGAVNIELYRGTGIRNASPIERMILATDGKVYLVDDAGNFLVDDEGNVLTLTA